MKKILIVLALMFLTIPIFSAGEGEGSDEVTPAICLPNEVVDFTWKYIPGATAFTAGMLEFFYEDDFGLPTAVTVTATEGDTITTAFNAFGVSMTAITIAKGATVTAIASGMSCPATPGSYTWVSASDPDGESGSAISDPAVVVVAVATPTVTPTTTPIYNNYSVISQGTSGKEFIYDGPVILRAVTISNITPDVLGNTIYFLDVSGTATIPDVGDIPTSDTYLFPLYFHGFSQSVTINLSEYIGGRLMGMRFEEGIGVLSTAAAYKVIFHLGQKPK